MIPYRAVGKWTALKAISPTGVLTMLGSTQWRGHESGRCIPVTAGSSRSGNFESMVIPLGLSSCHPGGR